MRYFTWKPASVSNTLWVIVVRWPFDNVVTWQIQKTYIYSSAKPIAIRLGRVATCGWETPPSKPCDLLIMWSHDKCKNLYLHFHNIYGQQSWHSSNLRWGDTIFKVTWTFNFVVTWQMKKTYIYTYTMSMATRLGRGATYIREIPSTTSHNLSILWSREKWKTL